MIKSFRDRKTEAIFKGKRVSGLPSEIDGRARRKLRMLDAAATIRDLQSPPSNRLEKLAGNRTQQRILGQ